MLKHGVVKERVMSVTEGEDDALPERGALPYDRRVTVRLKR